MGEAVRGVASCWPVRKQKPERGDLGREAAGALTVRWQWGQYMRPEWSVSSSSWGDQMWKEAHIQRALCGKVLRQPVHARRLIAPVSSALQTAQLRAWG